jgi:hypothetical protein
LQNDLGQGRRAIPLLHVYAFMTCTGKILSPSSFSLLVSSKLLFLSVWKCLLSQIFHWNFFWRPLVDSCYNNSHLKSCNDIFVNYCIHRISSLVDVVCCLLLNEKFKLYPVFPTGAVFLWNLSSLEKHIQNTSIT